MILSTRITAIGPEVMELAESGVLILFADGAPPELAEVSVMHRQEFLSASDEPVIGTPLAIGPLTGTITAVGPKAWAKVREMGHVVINFNGASEAERPGEICASRVDGGILASAIEVGSTISIG